MCVRVCVCVYVCVCVCVWVRLLDTFAVDLWHNLWYEIYIYNNMLWLDCKPRQL